MAIFTAAAAIGASVVSFFTGTIAAAAGFGFFSTALIGFAVQAAIGLALNALTPKPKVRGANRGYQVTTRGSALDHQIIYGRMRTGGVVVYDETTGANNLYLHRVIAFAGHEVESFDEIYIDDDVLEFGGFDYTISLTRKVLIGSPRDGNYENQTSTVSISGIPTDEATFQVSDSLTKTEFDNFVRISSENDAPTAGTFVSATVLTRQVNTSSVIASTKYKGKVRINTHLGTADQTADADLVSESDKWTNEHRLRGIAYLYIRLQFDQNAFPNGVPDITATIKGKKVYDPREGAHDADDPSTWEWSDNPALCLRDYLSEPYGLNEESANIDDTLVSTAANVCDETDTVSGETRYTCNGAFVTQSAPVDMLNDMLTSMGGLLWYAQGEWRMKPAYYVAPTISFNEDDLRSNIAVKTRHSRRSNFNIVKGTFRGEESNWQVTDYPEVSNSAFITADNNQESVLDLELPFTDNADEARRIARIVLERNRQQLTVSASFGLRAFQVQTGDIIELTVERFGWTNKEFEVTSWTFGLTDNQDLQVQMTLREISESVFDEIDDGAIYELDNTALPNPFITPAPGNLSVSDGGFVADDGTYVNSFVVDWDAPDDAFVSFYVLEWRVEGGSVFNSVQVNSTEYQIYPVFENVNYEIRVKAINNLGVSGPYVTTIANVGGDVTAPGVVTSLSASGGLGFIEVNWTNPADADFNYVKIFESDDNVVGNASEIGRLSGNSFIRGNLGPLVTKYYWVSAVDYSGNESAKTGPVNATTNTITTADLGTAIIEYDNFASDVTDVFDGINADITAQASQINTLSSDLTTAEGNISGNATAISGLDTRVTDNEGDISAQASQISSLSTTVGNNTTTISQVSSSVDGIEGRYGVQIDNNGNISGYQLLSGVGGSAFNVRADQFAVFDSNNNGGDFPFTVFTSSRTINGVVYPAGTYVKDAYIDNAAIVDGSIQNAKIGNVIQSSNYSAGSTGWIINKDGSAEFNGVVISRQLLVDSGTFNYGSSSITRLASIGESFTRYVEATNVPISAWAGANKTYLCNVEVIGTIGANTADTPDVFWGFTGEILPLTKWSGNQTLRLKLTFWTKKVISVTNLQANWKIYEVT